MHEVEITIDFASVFTVIPNDLEAPPERGPQRFAELADQDDVPLVVCTHRLVPSEELSRTPSVIILRDPLDQLVSLYHLHRSSLPGNRFEGSLADFVRHSAVISQFVGWLDYYGEALFPSSQEAHSEPPPKALLLSYQDLQRDAAAALGLAVEFFGLPIDARTLDSAATASTFAKLQRLESSSQIPGLEYSRDQPDQRRIRRGLSGQAESDLGSDLFGEVTERFAVLGQPGRRLLGKAGIHSAF